MGAHFFNNPNEPNQRRVAVLGSAIRMHPQWDPSLIRNDIALVQLPSAVELNAFIRPVILPTEAQRGMDFSGELVSTNGLKIKRIGLK